MATSREMRDWARELGHHVPERGQLPFHIKEAYGMAHPDETADPVYPTGEDFPAAFGEPPEPPYAGEETPETVTPEVRPARPARGRPKGSGAVPARPVKPGGGGFLGRLRGAGKSGAPKGGGRTRRPRVSTENMLAGGWRLMAKLAAPMPPLQRTLRIQAPVAGMLLEDTVRGTALDVLLQPFARVQGQGRAVGALLGPPVIVTALSLHAAQRAGMDPPQAPNPFFVEMGVEALRSALMTWMEVAGPKFEIALAKEAEFESKYGQSVDALIDLLLAAPPANPAEEAEQEAAIRRAQGYAEAA